MMLYLILCLSMLSIVSAVAGIFLLAGLGYALVALGGLMAVMAAIFSRGLRING